MVEDKGKRKSYEGSPSSGTPKKPTTRSSSGKKRKDETWSSPSSSKRSKNGEAMEYITQNEDCAYRGKGEFKDDINWMTELNPLGLKAVEDKIYDQGLHKACFAWGAGKGTEATLTMAGEEVSATAIQDILDRTSPTVVKEGNVAAALQFIKKHGVSRESDYAEYHGKLPTEESYPLPPRGQVLYRIDDWQPVDDDEDAMLKALQDHVLIVSVLQFEAFQNLQGKCLFDMAEAEARHGLNSDDSDESQESVGSDDTKLIGHTLLLIGAGTFIPDDKRIKEPINYWILKNQWTKRWGFKGLGYLIRNSSIKAIHKGFRKTRSVVEVLKTEYLPYYAFAKGEGRKQPPPYVSKHRVTDFSVDDLIKWVNLGNYHDDTLIYMFYDPEYCKENGIDANEEFSAIEKAYHNTPSHVKMARVDLMQHDTAAAKFRLREEEKLVLLVFLPFQGRSMEYARKFEGNFNLAEILLWLGGDLSAGPCPIKPSV